MSERVESAVAIFSEGFMCSQAVFAAFSEMLGLEKDMALKIGNGFGGGVARRQDICGAVSGAIMAIGLKYGKTVASDTASHEKTYSTVESFCEEFAKRNGSINCYEILGFDLAAAQEKGLFSTVCHKCVRDAAQIVEDLLKDNI
ncbi:MAG: C_GCAxxG_C_C family protein [Clostridiaceae bacterium]|nr:C_GCAxxG_C_C family protein [Clostridiaceae bacterium]